MIQKSGTIGGQNSIQTHNKLLKSDCGKLSPFVQKDAQKPPIHRNRLARRYKHKEVSWKNSHHLYQA
jgi:hypothetical protein